MKKFLNISSWFLLTAYIIIILTLVSFKISNTKCVRVNVSINDNRIHRFINRDDVIKLIYEKKGKLLGYIMDSINTDELEQIIKQHPYIKNAEIYKTVYGTINIDIQQRNPILRVYNKFGKSFYIDQEGVLMPLSSKYTAHVIVANGNIPEPALYTQKVNIIESKSKNIMLYNLYCLARFISSNKFWNSFIEQIYVNKEYEFLLVPKVGRHIILFGKIDNFKEKFEKLLVLYKEGFSKIGWNRYKLINLKYKNQIVCVKR